jgi:aminoglycoside phosphotransferase (APT) family kinase protein
VLTSLEERLADLYDAGLDTADLREVIALAGEHTELLDEITEPRLLHGDLWTPNLMLASGAPKPTITGVLDHDRALWGDPAADWPIYVAGTRPGWVQEAFRSTYGETEGSTNAWWRSQIYRAWHIAAARMERQRLGKLDKIQPSYDDMREVLVSLLPRVL